MLNDYAPDDSYGSEPLEELTRKSGDTHKIRIGEEVFSEDFSDEPTKADENEETLRNGEPGKALRVKCSGPGCPHWTTYDETYGDLCYRCCRKEND